MHRSGTTAVFLIGWVLLLVGCGGPEQQSVAWNRWTVLTFDAAREEEKPLFLYTAPSWSRSEAVAADSLFRCPDIIRLLNGSFIPVREWSEDRNDLIRRYGDGMTPVMTVVAPDGTALMHIRTRDTERIIPMLKQALEIYAVYEPADDDQPDFVAPTSEDGEEVFTGDLIFAAIRSAYDLAQGGFSGQVKVPRPRVIRYLLKRLHATNDHHVEQMAMKTLTRMDEGGIHCRVSGGFSWISGNGTWEDPLPELPCALNAALLSAYNQAYLLTGNETYRTCAGRIYGFLTDCLLQPSDSLFLVCAYRDGVELTKTGPAYTDDNGLAVEGLVGVWAIMKEKKALALARTVLDRLTGRRDQSGMYRHTAGADATLLLTDQVAVLRGLLAVYEACGEDRYLMQARDLAVRIRETFYDDGNGGFYGTPRTAMNTGVPMNKDISDNCGLLDALRRIDFALESHDYRECSDKTVDVLRKIAPRRGMEAACFAGLLELRYLQPVEFFFVRQPDDWSTPQLIREAKRHFIPLANIKHYTARKKGLRRGALIFPYFLKSVGYVSINGRIHGAYDDPKPLGELLDSKGY